MAWSRSFQKKGKRFRRSVKARSPWTTRLVRSSASVSDSNFRSVIPRIRSPDFGYPDKLVTSLRYVDTFNLTGAAGAIGANVFRMNSLFDPDFTGLGHQPYFYDQLCGATGNAPYNKYRVIGSKMTVRFAISNAPSLAAANVGPVVVGITTNTSGGLYASSVSALMESTNTPYTILEDKSGGNNVKTLSVTFVPSRDLGMDVGDDTLAAGYSGNPSSTFYGIPWKVDTTGNATVIAFVEIDFRVEFFNRNEVAQS